MSNWNKMKKTAYEKGVVVGTALGKKQIVAMIVKIVNGSHCCLKTLAMLKDRIEKEK